MRKTQVAAELGALRKQIEDLKGSAQERRRVEAALRDVLEQYRALADEAPIGLCHLAPDGRVRLVNRYLARALDYESPGQCAAVAGVVGLFADAAAHHAVLDTLGESLDASSDSPPAWRAATWRARDGSPRPVRLLGRVLRDPGGAVEGYLLVVEPGTFPA